MFGKEDAPFKKLSLAERNLSRLATLITKNVSSKRDEQVMLDLTHRSIEIITALQSLLIRIGKLEGEEILALKSAVRSERIAKLISEELHESLG